MKIEQTEIRAAVIECLNEAVALNRKSVKEILLTEVAPYPPLLGHRNTEIAVVRRGPDEFKPGFLSALSVINAILDKLGVDAIVPSAFVVSMTLPEPVETQARPTAAWLNVRKPALAGSSDAPASMREQS